MNIELAVFQRRAGDHNDLAIPGAKSLATLLGEYFGLTALAVGTPEPALGPDWKPELAFALPTLQALQRRFEQIYAQGKKSVAATSRCAVSLATLPVVASLRGVAWGAPRDLLPFQRNAAPADPYSSHKLKSCLRQLPPPDPIPAEAAMAVWHLFFPSCPPNSSSSPAPPAIPPCGGRWRIY